MAGSSQKFIARNRAPRVQIEYDVELYGAEKKVQLPFVMGVMSDLAGKSNVDQGSVKDRKFLEIDVDNFDQRMSSIAPRVAFNVPNTLTGEGSLPVDLTFEKMSDFSPAAIAERVDSLRPLLQARQQLSNLMTYMDGKAGAEALIEKVLGDTNLLGALAAGSAPRSEEQEKALDALRAVVIPESTEGDSSAVLDSLRAVDQPEQQQDDAGTAALDGLRNANVEDVPVVDDTGAALDALRAQEVVAEAAKDTSATLDALRVQDVAETQNTASTDALDALRSIEIREEPEDTGEDALAALKAVETQDIADEDGQAQALDALRSAEVMTSEEDATDTALDALKETIIEEASDPDTSEVALEGLRATDTPDETLEDGSEAALATLEAVIEGEPEQDDTAAILADLDTVEDIEETDTSADILAGLEAVEEMAITDDISTALAGLEAIEETVEVDTPADVLAGIQATESAEEVDTSDAVLAGLDAIEETPKEDDLDAALAGLERIEEDVGEQDTARDVLAGLETIEVHEESDIAADILAGLEAIEEDVQEDELGAALAGLETPETAVDEDTAEDILAGLDMPDLEEAADGADDLDAALAGLEAPLTTETEDGTDDILAGLDTVIEPEETDDIAATLGSIEEVETVADEDQSADILAALEPVDEDPSEDDLDAALAGLELASKPEVEEGTDDILAGLDTIDEAVADTSIEDALAGLEATVDEAEEDTAADILADLDMPETAPLGGDEADDLDALLADLGEPEVVKDDPSDDLDAILSDLGDTEAATETDDGSGDLDDLLADLSPEPLDGEADLTSILSDLDDTTDLGTSGEDDLDALLVDIEKPAEAEDEPDDLDTILADIEAPETEAGDDLDTMLAELTPVEDPTPKVEDDLDALLAVVEANDDASEDDLDSLLAEIEAEPNQDSTDDLDDLLADIGTEEETSAEADDDLDVLLADIEDETETAEAEDDLDALLAGLGEEDESPAAGEDDLDALLNDLGSDAALTDANEGEDVPEMPLAQGAQSDSAEPVLAFGEMSADRPDADRLVRKRFRLAILGDFTGRAARGAIEIGDDLAKRAPILLDPDTVEDVIEGFTTTLVLPIGKDGVGVEVNLGGLDDLHPDELYENVEIFAALRDLKSQLSHGGTADSAAKSLVAWGAEHGQRIAPAKAVSGGNTVRADLKLSDFQKLIGDTGGTLAQPSPVDDLLARIVGPHIRKLPDPNVTAMAEVVDDALSGAMRMVLHHPEFQSVEAQWRAIDLIARSIEVDDTLEVMLYDVSAEEIAADLTQSDDLSQSGFVRLLTEGPMDEETGRGAYSAMMGMYTFEETPPHAQLLGRIARVAAHVDAPFFGAITPGFIETAKKDRHPLVANEWDTLRAMPEAGHLALASPRFLMRRPYGAKSEPIYEFEFEEFTQSAGLSGMLWANPVVLVSILLAKSFKENGASMGLGQIMSLGDMPYHYVLDAQDDQIALPCTERNLTLEKVETVMGRGYLPVISIKGRDEIRLGSFQSLAGGDILGPWTGVAPPPPSPPRPPKVPPAATLDEQEDITAGTDDTDLDDLLAGFDLDSDDGDENSDDDMDAELAALLADL